MVDILNQAKNVLNGKSPNAEKPVSPDNRIDRLDQCKVVWYQWANELSTDSKKAFNLENIIPQLVNNAGLAQARSYDISNHIESFTYTKSMQGAAGGFSLVLHNSFDWARFMRPGQWICVYLSSEGNLPLPAEVNSNVNSLNIPGLNIGLPNLPIPQAASSLLDVVPPLPLPEGPTASTISGYKNKLRVIGVIQRVGIVSNTNPDGTVEITYQVSGRDFGTVYEDTEIWFNANNAEAATFRNAVEAISTNFVKNLTELLSKYHDIFINPTVGLAKKITDVKSFFPVQWVLPDRLVNDLGLQLDKTGNGTFGDISNLKEFNPTIFENPDPFPLAGLQGRCWDRMKSLSQPEFHELFTELSDSGNPKVYFRPIPWALDTSRYPTLGKVMLRYEDLASDRELLPPLPVNLNISAALTSLADEAIKKLSAIGNPPDVRTKHSVPLSAVEVESYNLGPDYHSRANFFLVDSMKSAFDQQNSFALLAKNTLTQWPLRDENDIRRHGFRPLLINLNSFNLTNAQFFANGKPGNTPAQNFYQEANELIRDFHCNAEDYYSGTMTLAGGKNEIKLGKVIVTDKSFQGISDMIFYVEGYTDTFTVNVDGATSWTQSVNLTRGVQRSVLQGGSSKDKQATKSSTFHPFNKDLKSGPAGLLGKIKNVLK